MARNPQTTLDHARRDLETALRMGIDTTEARRRVDDAEAAVAQHQQAVTKTAAELRQERAERINTAVTSMVETEQDAIAAELSAILPGFPVAVQIDPYAARNLIEAREAQAETAVHRDTLAEELSTIQTRIANLEVERAEIAARRHERNPEDVGRLGFIDLDLADLRGMAERQQAAIASLPQENIGALTRQWNAAVQAARTTARLAAATELERRLLYVAQALKADGGDNVSARWRPSPELMSGVRTGVF